MKLTSAGERLLAYTNRILALSHEARAAVGTTGEVAGGLTVAAPDTVCAYRLPPVLRAFRREFPLAQLAFHAAASSKHARGAVLDGIVDIAVVLDDAVDSPNLVTAPIAPEPLCLLAAPDHPLAAIPAIAPENLENQPLVLTEFGCGYRASFESVLNDAGVSAGSTLELASIEAIKECVKAGMGVTLLPRVAAATEIHQAQLVDLPWHGLPLQISAHLVWHKDKWLSPAMSAFIVCAKELLGSGGPGAPASSP